VETIRLLAVPVGKAQAAEMVVSEAPRDAFTRTVERTDLELERVAVAAQPHQLTLMEFPM
jgi:hypothetical protein